MKSLNVKIPITIAQRMYDAGELNPIYLSEFIISTLDNADSLDKPISELCYNYTFKIDDSLHKTIKLKALEVDIPMNELVGRLIEKYYYYGRINTYG